MFEGDNERRGADDSPKVLVTKGVVLWKRGLIYVGRTIKKEFCTIWHIIWFHVLNLWCAPSSYEHMLWLTF